MAKSKRRAPSKVVRAGPTTNVLSPESSFAEVVLLIQQARERSSQAVNTELIDLYWSVGEYVSRKISSEGWGKGTIVALSSFIQRAQPGSLGFSPQNLWRMRHFYDTYAGAPELSTLLRELPWSAHLHVLSKAKLPEEREFYLRMAVQQRWGKRELERQIRLGAFEQAVLAPAKLSPAVREIHGESATAVFKDAYALEFLDLPTGHTEADLHRGLLGRLQAFLIELGRDFCFVGPEFPLQVGGRDFALDCSDLCVIPMAA